MAVTIRVTCPTCGVQDVGATSVRAWYYENAEARSYYEFDCPECKDTIVREAPPELIGVLETAVDQGLVITTVHIPEEALEEHPGACIFALTQDEILDFSLVDDPMAQFNEEEEARGRRQN